MNAYESDPDDGMAHKYYVQYPGLIRRSLEEKTWKFTYRAWVDLGTSISR